MPKGVYDHSIRKGFHHSEATKKKLRMSNLGKKLSAETINKLKGRRHSDETKSKMSNSHKGMIAWNKGLTKFNNDSLKLISEKNKGEKSYNWRGDKVGLNGIHTWIHRNFGKADRCENPNCVYPRKNPRGKLLKCPKLFQWSNKEHTYKRKKEDWIRLCCSCHTLYDNGKLIINFK